MSELSGHVQDYLRLRRALGFKLERAGRLLPQLVAYLEAAGAATVTSDLAIAWARLPGHAHPNHWAQRLAIARGSPPPLRAATYEALFGLLATCGMRVGEAVGLDRDDVDLQAGVITIRHAKFDRPRLVSLHPTVTEVLSRYAAERDRLCPRPRARAFFISSAGKRLDRQFH
jgi:integrase